MFNRTAAVHLTKLAGWYPAVALTGPRQSGKTTLARSVFPNKPYVSLEDPDQRAFAQSDGRAFLAQFPQGAVLDEVQRVPELLSWLQGVLDASGRMGLFVLTGSQQFALRQGLAQSLAGRIGHLELLPFSVEELAASSEQALSGGDALADLLLRGLYPPVHARGIPPAVWCADYVSTYVERDVRQMIQVRDLSSFQRFVAMCAARTGQLLNLSALAADCGITHVTAKAWISVLEASYLLMLLPPWHANVGKRLVKTPKLYLLDTGLAAWLAGLRRREELALGALRGPLFETLVVSECRKYLRHRGLSAAMHFWRDTHGHEVDLLIDLGDGRTAALECKSGHTVAEDWFTPLRRWSQAWPNAQPIIVYGGDADQLRSDVTVVAWRGLTRALDALFALPAADSAPSVA
ncbi:MAG: ATP-binding protein [Betaproteobacteria bacterium]|jgi:predicted AAA+ superfamily ATPase